MKWTVVHKAYAELNVLVFKVPQNPLLFLLLQINTAGNFISLIVVFHFCKLKTASLPACLPSANFPGYFCDSAECSHSDLWEGRVNYGLLTTSADIVKQVSDGWIRRKISCSTRGENLALRQDSSHVSNLCPPPRLDSGTSHSRHPLLTNSEPKLSHFDLSQESLVKWGTWTRTWTKLNWLGNSIDWASGIRLYGSSWEAYE